MVPVAEYWPSPLIPGGGVINPISSRLDAFRTPSQRKLSDLFQDNRIYDAESQTTSGQAPLPPEVKEIFEWMQRELELIAKAMQRPTMVHLEELTVAPPKPRDGMVVFADGTEWNPGAGRGYYGYYSSAWSKLG